MTTGTIVTFKSELITEFIQSKLFGVQPIIDLHQLFVVVGEKSNGLEIRPSRVVDSWRYMTVDPKYLREVTVVQTPE